MISVYVSSAWEEKETCKKIREQLWAAGFLCTSRWLDEEPALGGQQTDKERARVAAMDLYDLRRAQVVLFWNPEGYARKGTGGRHVEVGAALATGVPVILVGERTNVFHFLDYVHFFSGVGWLHGQTFDLIVARIKDVVTDFGPAWDEGPRPA